MSAHDRVCDRADNASELPQCVYSIHGIRTSAPWQSRLASQITDATGFETFSRNYGRFDLFMFVFKGVFSGSAWRLVASDLRDLKKRYRVNVVAHSFGTWLLLEILKDDPDIKVNNVILCGAIFPRALAWWRKLKTQSAQITGKVVNYCGRRDPFPALAEVLSRDYGASGVVGAGEPTVHDSFHDLGHSGFLTARFCDDFWIPFLKEGTLSKSDDNTQPLAYIEAILWIAAHRGAVLLAGVLTVLGLYQLYQTRVACNIRSCFVDVTRVQDYSRSSERQYVSQITSRYEFNFNVDQYFFNSNRSAKVVSYLGDSLMPITGINSRGVDTQAGASDEAPTRYPIPVIRNQAFFSAVMTPRCPAPVSDVGYVSSDTTRDLRIVLRLPPGAKIRRPSGDFANQIVVRNSEKDLAEETKHARSTCEVSETGKEIMCPGLYLRPNQRLVMPVEIEGWQANPAAVDKFCPKQS